MILNEGIIETTPGGRVALMGPRVENRGTIKADGGAVILATGHLFLVDVFGDGLVQFGTALTSVANGSSVSAPVVQMGDIRVGNGTVLLRRTNPTSLVGTLNSIPVAQIANQAVVLPGGAVAFVGSSGEDIHVGAPTWLHSVASAGGPLTLASAADVGKLGGGLIDVSPSIPFPVPPPQASNPAACPRLRARYRLRRMWLGWRSSIVSPAFQGFGPGMRSTTTQAIRNRTSAVQPPFTRPLSDEAPYQWHSL